MLLHYTLNTESDTNIPLISFDSNIDYNTPSLPLIDNEHHKGQYHITELERIHHWYLHSYAFFIVKIVLYFKHYITLCISLQDLLTLIDNICCISPLLSSIYAYAQIRDTLSLLNQNGKTFLL